VIDPTFIAFLERSRPRMHIQLVTRRKIASIYVLFAPSFVVGLHKPMRRQVHHVNAYEFAAYQHRSYRPGWPLISCLG